VNFKNLFLYGSFKIKIDILTKSYDLERYILLNDELFFSYIFKARLIQHEHQTSQSIERGSWFRAGVIGFLG
jgi:hypothetical protein